MPPHKKTPCEGEAAGLLAEGYDDSNDSCSGLHARLERYSSARLRACSMVAHLAPDHHHRQMTREYQALRDCGNYLLFRHYFTVDTYRLAALRSCRKHLLCPLCAIRRAAKQLKAYLQRYEVLKAENPALRPYLITFAIRNGDDLAERYAHLTASLRKLFKRRSNFRKGQSVTTELAKVEGAVWTFEVTNKNEGKGWHPHIHMIALCETPPNQQALRNEWEALTRDSFTVDVSRKEYQGDVAMFCEAFKYAMKFSELTLEHNLHAYRVLRGKRMIASLGCFRGVTVPPELTDDLMDDLPYIELLYRFSGSKGYSLANISEPVQPGRAAAAEGKA